MISSCPAWIGPAAPHVLDVRLLHRCYRHDEADRCVCCCGLVREDVIARTNEASRLRDEGPLELGIRIHKTIEAHEAHE